MIASHLTRRRCLACLPWLAAPPALLPARASTASVAPLLSHEAPEGIDPAPYLVSEKYDGVRACWDGQALRFRSGLPIVAPQWFVRCLPTLPLDGELWLGRGRFDALAGLVRRATPDDAGWRDVHYMVFELPLAVTTALQFVDELLASPNAVQIEPGENHWPILRTLLRDQGIAGNLTNDAHLAALCIERGATLHSADGDFSRFKGLRWENPLAR